MRYWSFHDWFMALLMACLGGLVVALLVGAIKDHKEWPGYRDAHHCVKTGNSRQDVYMIPIYNGKTTTLVPQFTTHYEWKCDNEVQWR